MQNAFGEVLQALDMREQRKALTGALRREATRVRRQSSFVLGSKIRNGRKVAMKAATRVYPQRYGCGFYVGFPGPRLKRVMYKNSRGQEKPLGYWFAQGTTDRKRRSSGKFYGRLKAINFLNIAEIQLARGVEERIFADFEANLDKTIQEKDL